MLPFARLSGKNLQADFDGGTLISDGGVRCDRLPIPGEDLVSQPTIRRLENAPQRREVLYGYFLSPLVLFRKNSTYSLQTRVGQ